MLKVRTGRVDCACIEATTSDESMPPERNAPSGTSEIIRSPTQRFKSVSNAVIASSSDISDFTAEAFSYADCTDQYGIDSLADVGDSRVMKCPGRSWWISLNTVRGDGM